MTWHQLTREWLLLRRQRVVWLGAPLVLLAGLLAIGNGHRVIERQREVLAEAEARQAAEHQAILRPQASAVAGDQLYYLAFHTVRTPSPWAPLALGQRDVHAFNLKVRIHALQGQLYDADLDNPLLTSFGTFDLAFVLVVIAPLFLIALAWNLRSGDEEQGTLPLLRLQASSVVRLYTVRLALRTGVVWATVMILFAIALPWLGLPTDQTLGRMLGVVTLYLIGWSALAGLVATLRRPSEVNLLLLLGAWIIGTALGPAFVNVAAGRRYPLPEALELTVAQRQGYHGAWDEPLADVMEAFYRRYPEWRTAVVPTDRYSNGWYYAMQQRGDDQARAVAQRYRAVMEAREVWSQSRLWWFPPAAVHAQLNALARTDQAAYLRYLDSVAAYHEALKRHFFPVIFSEQRVSDVDWALAPRHAHRD